MRSTPVLPLSFYCDFDRWLHWASTFPQELAELPRRVGSFASQPWYVCIGRTATAFATHPVARRLPEEATNRALGVTAGQEIDPTAGAAWISREAANLILRSSIAASKATDLEWPAIVLGAGQDRLTALFVDGLAFETSDFYREEQRQAGSADAWIRETYDRPEVLQQRLQLAVDSIAAMRSVLGDRL